MSTAKRLTTLLVVVACMPLIMAGGGNFPPTTGLEIVTSTIDATIIVDPHQNTGENADGTPSGRMGRITLIRNGVGNATETFEIVPFGSFGALTLGCTTTTSVLEARFGSASSPQTMASWMGETAVIKLFAGVGITVLGTAVPPRPRLEPIVTKVRNAKCVQWYKGATIFPDPNGPPEGFLSINADIGFAVTPGTVIPSK